MTYSPFNKRNLYIDDLFPYPYQNQHSLKKQQKSIIIFLCESMEIKNHKSVKKMVEFLEYSPFFLPVDQLETVKALQPKVIVTLGSTPTKAILGAEQKMTQIKGKLTDCKVGDHSCQVLPIIHPDFLAENPGLEKLNIESLEKIKNLLELSS